MPQNYPNPFPPLTGNRLNLHNKILTLIRENDLEEAALYTRHSVYSNCKPTIYTVNAVLNAQLRQSKYSDLLSLHRFITQAGIAANMVNEAPLSPSPTTYRIMIKGFVDNGKLEKALELHEELKEKMGGEVVGNGVVVYGGLMKGYFMRGMKKEAMECYGEFLRENLRGKWSAVCE
ncbi:hypothetical protein NC651_028110 [Populus alba x Populus x berolinensis]|nr:hypothetical protein NC651_028110 [Populus alba x Populus x berolinensis]